MPRKYTTSTALIIGAVLVCSISASLVYAKGDSDFDAPSKSPSSNGGYSGTSGKDPDKESKGAGSTRGGDKSPGAGSPSTGGGSTSGKDPDKESKGAGSTRGGDKSPGANSPSGGSGGSGGGSGSGPSGGYGDKSSLGAPSVSPASQAKAAMEKAANKMASVFSDIAKATGKSINDRVKDLKNATVNAMNALGITPAPTPTYTSLDAAKSALDIGKTPTIPAQTMDDAKNAAVNSTPNNTTTNLPEHLVSLLADQKRDINPGLAQQVWDQRAVEVARELGIKASPVADAAVTLAAKGRTINELRSALKEVQKKGNLDNAVNKVIGLGIVGCTSSDCAAAKALMDLSNPNSPAAYQQALNEAMRAQRDATALAAGSDIDKEVQGAGSTRGGDTDPGAANPSNPNTPSNSNPNVDPDKEVQGAGSARGGDTDPGAASPDNTPTADYSTWTGLGDENGQKLGQSYSGPKGVGSLSYEATKAAAKSLGYDVPAVPAKQDDIDKMARMILAETQSIKNAKGKMKIDGAIAVADVIRNRVLSTAFPNTIVGVLTQPRQFTPAAKDAYLGVQFGPTNKDYEVAQAVAKSVLDGTSVPVAVTADGKGMVNYGNIDTIQGPKSQASQKSKDNFNDLAADSKSFTISDAKNPGTFQQTFGTIGNPNVPDFTPNDGVAKNSKGNTNTSPQDATPQTAVESITKGVGSAVKGTIDTVNKVEATVRSSVKGVVVNFLNSVKSFFKGSGSSAPAETQKESGGGEKHSTTTDSSKQSNYDGSFKPQSDAVVSTIPTGLIQSLFIDTNNTIIHYAAVATTTSGWFFIRQAYLNIDTAGYLYEIGTEQFSDDNSSYGVPLYLMLTHTYGEDTNSVTITYTDEGADGSIEYVYINGAYVNEKSILDVFQKRYDEDLVKTAGYINNQ